MRRQLLCLFLLIAVDCVAIGFFPFLVLAYFNDNSAGTLAITPLLIPVSFFVALAWEGTYVHRRPFAAELRHIARATTIALLFLMATGPVLGKKLVSFQQLLGIGIMIIALLGILRWIAKCWLFEKDLWRREVILVGTGRIGRRLAKSARRNPFTGLEIVGVIHENEEFQGNEFCGIPAAGGLLQLERFLEISVGGAPRDVLIALPDLDRNQLQHLFECIEGKVGSIRFVPDILGLSTLGVELENFHGTLAIRLKQNLLKPWNRLIKRLFDVVVGIPIFITVMPALALLSVLIVRETPGPSVIAQPRMGRRGLLFKCLKLRTMYIDADRRLAYAIGTNAALEHEWSEYHKLKSNDPRVTPLGKWLRRFSMDELPQLWNVLSGDMSLIGPRPYLPMERPKMGQAKTVINSVRPGLTGLWQVSGRNELSFEERVMLDEYYVRNWSVGLDLWILLRTAWVLMSGKGAF